MDAQEMNRSQPVVVSFDVLVTDELLELFTLVNYVIITGFISFFGIIFNVVNFIVFLKIGFTDPVNIPLLGLTIADLASLIPMFWMGLCYNPLIVHRYRQLDFRSIQHLTAGWPHVLCTRITSWLTVFITFERYLCVAHPLTVKSMLTPSRTAVIVIAIFIIFITSVIPIHNAVGLGFINSSNNQTIFGLFYFPNGLSIESAAVSFISAAQLLSFASVVVCTVGLVTKYNESSKWRKSISNSLQNKDMSTRDKRTVKMIISISTIFIISFLPGAFGTVVMFSYKEFNITGLYSNLFIACGTFYFCLEAVNSTVNIFVYLKMSSKYRQVFTAMFMGTTASKTLS